MSLYAMPIVEGDTEANCIKKLLSRVWREELQLAETLCVLEPLPANRGSLLKPSASTLADKLEEAQRRIQSRCRLPEDHGFILLMLDAEEDCPKSVSEDVLIAP